MFLSTHGIIASSISQGGGYLPLTNAWIAETGENDLTIINALNTLEGTGVLTSAIKAFYPMVGGTSTKHKYNFMNCQDTDAAFRLTFSGGWVHSSTGAKPNGSNGKAVTYLNPTNTLSQNSVYMGMYSRTAISEPSTEMGYNIAGTVFDMELYLNVFYSYINGPLLFNGVTTAGYFSTSRIASTTSFIAKNGSTISTSASPSTGCADGDITLGTSNLANFTTKEFASAVIATGLTEAEDLALYNAIQSFNTELSRNV